MKAARRYWRGTLKWTLFAIGIATTVAMALIVGRAAHKRLGIG